MASSGWLGFKRISKTGATAFDGGGTFSVDEEADGNDVLRSLRGLLAARGRRLLQLEFDADSMNCGFLHSNEYIERSFLSSLKLDCLSMFVPRSCGSILLMGIHTSAVFCFHHLRSLHEIVAIQASHEGMMSKGMNCMAIQASHEMSSKLADRVRQSGRVQSEKYYRH